MANGGRRFFDGGLSTDSFVGVIVRHGLTFASGILVSKGIVDSGTAEAVSGAVLALVSFWLSRNNKLNSSND